MNLEERFYTSTEVAEILGVSLRSVYRYLEEGKLDAEIKTATGRHRFTKDNILSFLYPNKDKDSNDIQIPNLETPIKIKPSIKVDPKIAKIERPVVVEPVEEEPVDWLAKFREAADKFKNESPAVVNTDGNAVSSLSLESAPVPANEERSSALAHQGASSAY